MDEEANRVNAVSNQYLRNLVSAYQRDWADYVGRAEFIYNVATHLVTKWLWFFMAYVVDALQPTNIALKRTQSTLKFNKDGENLAHKREQVLKMTKLLWEKTENATERMSMPEDKK